MSVMKEAYGRASPSPAAWRGGSYPAACWSPPNPSSGSIGAQMKER